MDPERIESSPLIEAMMNSPEPKGTAPAMADGAKIFIEGRYRKLVRDLPQTLFYCPKCKGHPRRRKGCETCEGFGKLTRDSVQELVAWVIGKAFGTRKNKFHGAGREDMDVCMLGDGRPFILELANPKTYGLDLAELEAEVNSRNAGRIEVLARPAAEKSTHLLDARPPQGAFMVIEIANTEKAYARACAKGLPIAQELKEQPWRHRNFCVTEPNGIVLYFYEKIEK